MDKFFHSVSLVEDLCTGCINCLKRCPTQAIRVQHGKARIIKEFCIDCGECVRTCQNHAKIVNRDTIDCLKEFEYTVALPAPSLYSQFNNMTDINVILTGLLKLGFDDVYEVAAAAEIVTEVAKEYIESHEDKWPLVSAACPSVVRLIRVRFPNLIEHLLPINPPVEVAAIEARRHAVQKTGLPPEKIGIIFISPCPSKVAYIKSPLGIGKSEINRVIGIADIYPLLLQTMSETEEPMRLSTAGRHGVGWGRSTGEALALQTNEYLSADGIENVLKVLEDLEDEKFGDLKFIELDACSGGCVGGVLTVENPFIARAKLKRINESLPVREVGNLSHITQDEKYWWVPVSYEPVFQLGNNFMESVALLKKANDLYDKFPKLDCGICGAPTCMKLAEDIVKGMATESQCIHILKKQIHDIAVDAEAFASNAPFIYKSTDNYVSKLEKYLNQISQLDAELNKEF